MDGELDMICYHKGRKGVIAVRSRRMAAIALAVGMILGLTACMGFWNTPIQLGNLIIGPVVVTGAGGYVLVSVADMPGGGLASIQFGTVANEAIVFANIDASTITIEGKNGFVVLAQDFATVAGKGTLIAVNAATGVVGGTILKFAFTVTGANPTFTVYKTKVTLGSDSNAMIAAWDTSSLDYYTK